MNLLNPFPVKDFFNHNSEWKHFPLQDLIHEKNDKMTNVLSEFEGGHDFYKLTFAIMKKGALQTCRSATNHFWTGRQPKK